MRTSVFPVRAASRSSSFWYSPVRTRWVEGSAKSKAVLPSVFLMEQSAPFWSKAKEGRKEGKKRGTSYKYMMAVNFNKNREKRRMCSYKRIHVVAAY